MQAAVFRWLQQTKGIAVQKQWLEACIEWIQGEEVSVPRSIYTLMKGDLDPAGKREVSDLLSGFQLSCAAFLSMNLDNVGQISPCWSSCTKK